MVPPPQLLATPPQGLLPGHLGALHPVEQGLTLLLAFGPFAVLGVVVAVRRRRDAAVEERHRTGRRGLLGRPVQSRSGRSRRSA